MNLKPCSFVCPAAVTRELPERSPRIPRGFERIHTTLLPTTTIQTGLGVVEAGTREAANLLCLGLLAHESGWNDMNTRNTQTSTRRMTSILL